MRETNYTRQIIDDYCVLDTETTGLSAYYDEIIEIGIIRVRNNQIVDKYSQLIHPEYEINEFITLLTGITNEMVTGMPSISEVKAEVLSFLGDDIIVGHNTSFDIRFLNEGFQETIGNAYIDTMQFARKVYPELSHHRLSDLADYLNISNNSHRAMADCITTKELYDAIKNTMSVKKLGIEDLWVTSRYHAGKKIDISKITPKEVIEDEDGFFYGRHVAFTGKLDRMVRRDAMQLVVNLGGILDTGVTKNTNYLILGNNDYNASLHGEKSSKHKKAERYKLDGYDIDIIDELTFYDLLNAYTQSNNSKTEREKNTKVTASKNAETADWKEAVRNMLMELTGEYELPNNSLYLSDNYGQSGKTPQDIISHSVCIWEPDYPPMSHEIPAQNKLVATIALSKVVSRPDDLVMNIRETQLRDLWDYIPDDAEVLNRTKSDQNTGMLRIRIDKYSPNLIGFIRRNTIYCIERYESKATKFGCCSKYEMCSDAKKCIHINKLYSKACMYRKNLEQGKIFYGKNRNN